MNHVYMLHLIATHSGAETRDSAVELALTLMVSLKTFFTHTHTHTHTVAVCIT